VRGGHASYPPGSFDFLAAYAAVDDTWYIIPEAAIEGKTSVTLYPKNKPAHAKFEEYKEAWHLLKEEHRKTKKVDRIQACAEDLSTVESTNPSRSQTEIHS